MRRGLQLVGEFVELSALEPEHGCCDGINWRCVTRGALTAEQLEGRLGAAGFESRCTHPWLSVLRDSRGNEAVWVPATGRVQLRIHLSVERELRRAEAESLHASVAEALGRGDPPTARARKATAG